jgi:serine/threonine protein kinase
MEFHVVKEDFLGLLTADQDWNVRVDRVLLTNTNIPAVRKLTRLHKYVGRSENPLQELRMLQHVNEHCMLGFPARFPVLYKAEQQGDFLSVCQQDCGKDVFSLLGPQLTVQRVIGIFRQAVDAVLILHSQQIYHMDLKPENLMVEEIASDGKLIDFVRVIDFGQAQMSPTLDRLGFGTPVYAPPESRNHPVRINSAMFDVYSLGISLYVMLFRTYPWFVGNPMSKYHWDKMYPQATAPRGDVTAKCYEVARKIQSAFSNNKMLPQWSPLCQLLTAMVLPIQNRCSLMEAKNFLAQFN